MTLPSAEFIQRAADAIASADALVLAAGAGMGVDSGLPDFRGTQGFWKAYPAYAKLGLDFASMANPKWFAQDPALAWGFYGHRLELYRATRPHEGFHALLRWAKRARDGAFVFTSNVDGQFQRAGFEDDRVVEIHGAIDWLQCTTDCGAGIFEAHPFRVAVDAETFRAAEPLPKCPRCGALARPNILMFGDWAWDQRRTAAQEARYERFLAGAGAIVVVECGAGGAIPTVRRNSEMLLRRGAKLVRINPREPEGPAGTIGTTAGAKDALLAIDAELQNRGI